ncbi:MAG: hypothetical protein WC089_00900 [Candidatus Paceibacterota bacterium]
MKDKILINFFLISESFLIENVSNNLSLIGVFENINSPIIPIAYPKFSASVNFTVLEPANLKCSVVIYDPDGIEIARTQEFSTQTINKNQKVQLLNSFVNTVFNKLGNYSVNLIVNDEKISLSNLTIKKI